MAIKAFSEEGIKHATINGHRFHLRMGQPSLLWIDGQQPPIILDETAGYMFAYLIEGMWLYQCGSGDKSSEVINHVVEGVFTTYGSRIPFVKQRVTRNRIKADLDRIFGTIMGIAEGECPASMGLSGKAIRYGQWTAPARMDLAITYRCNLKCGKCYLGEEGSRELTTVQFENVLDKLWEIGVPQVVFTGGEPTLRDDLCELVANAEEFVTGLVTNGTKLAELAKPLVEASLDYAQVTIESSIPDVHDAMTCTKGSHQKTVEGISTALESGLQIVTNTTLTRLNAPDFPDMVRWLHGIGVKQVACNTLICTGRGKSYKSENGLSDAELRPILEKTLEIAEGLGVTLQWYSPTCYNQGINPLELGLGAKACSAAAHNMTVRPDGFVIPCQSWPDTVGNILVDDWSTIWNHPLSVKLRAHGFAQEKCVSCSNVKSCGGGCPLDTTTRSYG